MDFISILEIIGTVAFALSGALLAIENRLDFFGILVLATCTAVGGGLLRDIILDVNPPIMFVRPFYCVTAVITAAVIILFFRWTPRLAGPLFKRLNSFIILLDALGLSVFTIQGTAAAITGGYGGNAFLSVFVGVTTGVGGGILRDLLVNRKPVVLRKEIYASASLAGGIAYYLLRGNLPDIVATYTGILIIMAVRIISVRRRLNLPMVDMDPPPS